MITFLIYFISKYLFILAPNDIILKLFTIALLLDVIISFMFLSNIIINSFNS